MPFRDRFYIPMNKRRFKTALKVPFVENLLILKKIDSSRPIDLFQTTRKI